MLIPSFYPRIGGAERQLSGLIPFLTNEGVQPFILTRRLPGTLAREQINGVPIVRTWARNNPLSFLFSSLLYLTRHRDDWDLIHVHTTYSPALLAATAGWLFGKPVVVKVTRSGPTAALARLQRSWWGRSRFRFLCKFTDTFVVLNQEIYNDLLCMGVQENRLYNIPNGVDTNRFYPLSLEQRTRLRRELGLNNVPVVICVGRLIPRKGVRLLLDIWPALLQKVPKATLLLVGHGPQIKYLQSVVQSAGLHNNVRFMGECEQQEVIRLLQVSDCFVLPSASEGVSNALLEAMAAGIAPVVSRIAGNLELISDGVNGLIFDKPEELGVKLERCLLHEDLRYTLGSRARQTMLDHFSMSQVVSQLIALYTHLLRKTGKKILRSGDEGLLQDYKSEKGQESSVIGGRDGTK